MAKKGKKDTFEKRLKVYSAAAAGVLAIAPSAEAAIHYSGIQNLPVSSSTSQNIDLNNDGNNDFVFHYWQPIHGSKLIVMDASGDSFIHEFIHSDAANLPSNYLIGPNLSGKIWYSAKYSTLNGTYHGNTITNGNFINATGYIGVRFHTSACQGSNFAYGWIHYQGTTSIGNTSTGTIIDWAYEDNCQPIAAGSTVSTAAIPTLNQWGVITLVFLLGGLAAKMLKKEEKEES